MHKKASIFQSRNINSEKIQVPSWCFYLEKFLLWKFPCNTHKKACWELYAMTYQQTLPDPCRASVFQGKGEMDPTLTRDKLCFLGHDELINPVKAIENYPTLNWNLTLLNCHKNIIFKAGIHLKAKYLVQFQAITEISMLRSPIHVSGFFSFWQRISEIYGKNRKFWRFGVVFKLGLKFKNW